jgi:hypothetical protein
LLDFRHRICYGARGQDGFREATREEERRRAPHPWGGGAYWKPLRTAENVLGVGAPPLRPRPPAVPHRSCHSRATPQGQARYPADNHGHLYATDVLVVLARPARTHPANVPDKHGFIASPECHPRNLDGLSPPSLRARRVTYEIAPRNLLRPWSTPDRRGQRDAGEKRGGPPSLAARPSRLMLDPRWSGQGATQVPKSKVNSVRLKVMCSTTLTLSTVPLPWLTTWNLPVKVAWKPPVLALVVAPNHSAPLNE